MADEAPKEYHLHKHQPSKLQLAVRDLAPYLKKHGSKATKAHSHSYYQIILFATEGRHYVDYEVVSHARQTAFVLLPGQIHYFCPDVANEGRIIQFNEQFLARFDPKARDVIEYRLFNELTPESLTIARPEWEKICGVLELLEREIADRKNDYPTQSYHLLRTLITYLERAQEAQYGEIPAASKDYQLTLKFKRLIQENIGTFPDLEQYSAWLNTSTKTLNRMSKRYLNDTPANVIKKRKILEAKRLLANRHMQVKEVGYALGFDEPSNFTKYFSKVVGIRPKEFQQQLP